MSCAAAILAGGQATRMGGRSKSLVVVEGARVIDRQLAVLEPLFEELLIVANDRAVYEPFGHPVVADVVPGQKGPLIGILTALEAARADQVVCVGCDMPFLDGRALALVRDRDPDADVVVPIVAGYEEPLHARYGRAAVPAIRAQIASGDYKVSRFFDRVRTTRIAETELRALDGSLRFLSNINTLAQLESKR